MKDTFVFHNHLCIVFEMLSVNLYELIKQNQFRGLSTHLVRMFVIQILDCLVVLNRAKIIHCDLKPEVSMWMYEFKYHFNIFLCNFGWYVFRTFFLKISTPPKSKSLTLVQPAMKTKPSTHTSNPDSTDPLKFLLDSLTPHPSTCGLSVALLQNYS